MCVMNQISQRELKEQIVDNPHLTYEEKTRELNRLRRPYQAMSDEELLQLVRDFVKENDRLPTRKDLIYDTVLKQRFGPWGRMLEQAGVKEVAYTYLERRKRRKEKKRGSDTKNTADRFGSRKQNKKMVTQQRTFHDCDSRLFLKLLFRKAEIIQY